MEALSWLLIGYSLVSMCNGYYWLYYKFKKSEEQTITSQKSLDLPRSSQSAIINDIELDSVRYYLKGDQVLPIRVEGLLLKDGCVYIQQMESNKDVLNRIIVEGSHYSQVVCVKIYNQENNIFIESIPVGSSDALNSAKATLIEKHRGINLQLKLSETFETEDEAKQTLLSRLDSQFDNELQLLQDKYNKQLDTLI